jgi:hypothetical protein
MVFKGHKEVIHKGQYHLLLVIQGILALIVQVEAARIQNISLALYTIKSHTDKLITANYSVY